MKQVQFTFQDDKKLEEELRKLRQWARSNFCSKVLIQICTEIPDRERIGHVCETIERLMPEALYAGCSSNGNIVNGDFSGGSIAVICTLFEYPSTHVEVLQYPLQADTQENVVQMLEAAMDERPWVKAVELLVTIRGMSMTTLCESLSHIRKSFVTGWKPLGSFMHVTAADGCILKELNHRPAYEIYYKYLHIRNDEFFFNNTLEFPFLYRHNGIDIMRAPVASNPDGSLTMTSDMSQDVQARIAYGDPWTILDSVWKEGNKILQFAPECIFVFSCAARRTFWGNNEVGKETEPYQRIAPTSGFYTSGEFLRTGDNVNQHNVTQVIAAMREGEPKELPEKELSMDERTFEGKVSMINRMATFIKVTTTELEEANRKLSEMAVVDGMTGVGNKTAYLQKIHSLDDAIQRGTASFTVYVFDLNGLKGINDKYGHESGDMAITDAAEVLKTVFGKENLYRIGGDEFIAVFDGMKKPDTERCFADLEKAMRSLDLTGKLYKEPLAIAKGAAAFCPGEDKEYRDVFRRADQSMYEEKTAYYKTHDRRRR